MISIVFGTPCTVALAGCAASWCIYLCIDELRIQFEQEIEMSHASGRKKVCYLQFLTRLTNMIDSYPRPCLCVRFVNFSQLFAA